MTMGSIGLGVDTGAGAKIEYIRTLGQQIQRHLQKPVAYRLVPGRGLNEFVVLLANMHAVDYLKRLVRVSAGQAVKGCLRGWSSSPTGPD
ncbi:hypothetical protein DYGSA30_32500 [Dyella sp. GSA-30]|nr:hypothetical protein DYGSA30_32500 [Dyella sp. GSA-30]